MKKFAYVDTQVTRELPTVDNLNAVKTPMHDQEKAFVLSKKKKNSFSLKILCTGNHGRNMVPQELYVVCHAKNQGTSFLLKSEPFVLMGSRDKTRKVPEVPTETQKPANVTVFDNTLSTNYSAIQSSNTDPPQDPETAHSYQQENPPPSYEIDSPYVPDLEGIDFLDFHRGRFANWLNWKLLYETCGGVSWVVWHP